MKMNEFLQRELLGEKGCGYFSTLRALLYVFWAALVKPPKFQVGGQVVENVLGNGTLRVIGGSILMIFTGAFLLVFGILATLWIMLLTVISPVSAAIVVATVRWKVRGFTKELNQRIAAAREERRRGD